MRLVRHGPVAAEGLCYGQFDLPTRASPDECAKGLIRLAKAPCVWSSPLLRCAETAACLASAWGVPLQLDARLMEVSFGEWEGRTWADIEATDGARLAAWMAAWQTRPPPGGETLTQFEGRVASVLGEMPSEAVVLTHAGVVRCLSVIKGLTDWASAMKQAVPHLEVVDL